jgi:hypothetical protein
MDLYNHIQFSIEYNADRALYYDGQKAVGEFEKLPPKDAKTHFRGEDLPIVTDTNVIIFSGETKETFRFDKIFQKEIKVPANDNSIAVIEFPEMIYLNKENKIDRLFRFIILKKTDNYFTAPLEIYGLKSYFKTKLMAKLLNKNVTVYYYKEYSIHPISRKQYLESMD